MDVSQNDSSSSLPEQANVSSSSGIEEVCCSGISHSSNDMEQGDDSSRALKEKVQNLPLLCMEAICRLTPTSKLARLYSNAVPLPGAFWSVGLEAVLKKRLPLSLAFDGLPHHQAYEPTTHDLFDAMGAKVASVKRPEALRYSPLAVLIESATVALRVIPLTPGQAQLYAVKGETLLSQLPNITELTLVLHDVAGMKFDLTCLENRDLLSSSLSLLLPRLQSISFIDANGSYRAVLAQALAAFMRHHLPVQDLPELRRLVLPEFAFTGVMQALTNTSRPVLRSLSSLGIWQQSAYRSFVNWADVARRLPMLRFLPSHFAQISALFLRVDGSFSDYLTAFRALPGLTTLGMHVHWADVKGLTSNEDARIASVVDLRFIYTPCHPQCAAVLAIASLFPNTATIAFQSDTKSHLALDLVSTFCAKRVLPAVETLRCFHLVDAWSCLSWPTELFLRFIANPNLPETVDLSPVFFYFLIRTNSDMLTAVYCAMQSNSVTRLLLRGSLHREALPHLQRRIDLFGENAKVSAWKDRDLDDQAGFSHPAVASVSEISIVGMKTSGLLSGTQFTIRIVHELTRQRHIFD